LKKSKKQGRQSQEGKALKHKTSLHQKIYAARVIFNNNGHETIETLNDPLRQEGGQIIRQTSKKGTMETLFGKKSIWTSSTQIAPPRQFNIEDRKDIEDYFKRKKTLKDPYKVRPRTQAKWICAKNVISAHVRLVMIMRNIALYGTSETMLDIGRGIKNIRDFMIPDSGNNELKFEEVLIDSNPDLFMIMTNSIFRKIWSGILIFLLLYTATVMPYKIALIDDDENDPMFYMDSVVDFLFMIDIYVNFNTPLQKENTK
jgi:hypothetical protein